MKEPEAGGSRIATYIWVVTNRTAPAHRGTVQLVDASAFWVPMRKSLGDKRRAIPREMAREILALVRNRCDGETHRVKKDDVSEDLVVSRVLPTTHFGFRKITVERPLRLNFQSSPQRIARLAEERGFAALAQSKKKGAAGARDQAAGRALQAEIHIMLGALPGTLVKDREEFRKLLDAEVKKAGLKLAGPVKKAILAALSERDETAAICRDSDGWPEPDPELRDSESIPLAGGKDPVDADGIPLSVREFVDREVLPHVPDAWINTEKRDHKDGRVGLVGYEINFNRYFYRYTPPRPLEEIESDIREIEDDIVRMLAEVSGSGRRARYVGTGSQYANILC